jgi:hypothetical protein
MYLAKVQAIAKDPHVPMFNELIFILDNPLSKCPNGPHDGPLEAPGEIIHHVYLDVKDNLEQGVGCTYAHTCVSSQKHGCTLDGFGRATVLQFKAKTR